MEKYKEWLGQKVKVVIDRPLGSIHPEFPDHIYPINYGHLPGTLSEADNEEIDAYVLGLDKPVVEFEGTVIAVVARTGEEGEIKLVVNDGAKYSIEEIERAIHFQEKYYQHNLLI